MEDRLLLIGSGAFFDGNMAGEEANDIFAEDGSVILVDSAADDVTVINSGISDADYYSLDDGPWTRGSATLVQTGSGRPALRRPGHGRQRIRRNIHPGFRSRFPDRGPSG